MASGLAHGNLNRCRVNIPGKVTVLPPVLWPVLLPVLFCFLFLTPGLLRADSKPDVSSSRFNDLALALNTVRLKYGVNPLARDRAAESSANLYSLELSRRRLLAHRDLNGQRVAGRYRLAGGTGMSVGENLGAGDTVESIIRAWLESPSHRANLLNPGWNSAGAGSARLPGGRILLVAVFTSSLWSETGRTIDKGLLNLQGIVAPGASHAPMFLDIGTRTIPAEGQGRAQFSIPLSVFDEPGVSFAYLRSHNGTVTDRILFSDLP